MRRTVAAVVVALGTALAISDTALAPRGAAGPRPPAARAVAVRALRTATHVLAGRATRTDARWRCCDSGSP